MIDILQQYNGKKRAEHILQAALLRTGASSVHPKEYAKRMQTFVSEEVIWVVPGGRVQDSDVPDELQKLRDSGSVVSLAQYQAKGD